MGRRVRHDPFAEIIYNLQALQTLCLIDEKMKAIVQAKNRCHQSFMVTAGGTTNEDSLKALDEFYDKIEEIERLAYNSFNYTVQVAADSQKMISICHIGKQNNDHVTFQDKVMEFFEWIFINEMRRIDLKSIERGHLRRDVAFEVLNEFDTFRRCGLEFSHMFIECKNLRRPRYKALLQTFTYTLTCTDSRISRVPLSILVSRENPQPGSTS